MNKISVSFVHLFLMELHSHTEMSECRALPNNLLHLKEREREREREKTTNWILVPSVIALQKIFDNICLRNQCQLILSRLKKESLKKLRLILYKTSKTQLK